MRECCLHDEVSNAEKALCEKTKMAAKQDWSIIPFPVLKVRELPQVILFKKEGRQIVLESSSLT